MATPLARIEPLLSDPDITDLLIDGWRNVSIAKGGELIDVPTPFENDAQVLELIQAIAEPLGRVADESHPLLDLRLADGSRVNVVIPPISLTGPVLTIRKFYRRTPFTLDELVAAGTLSADMGEFLRAAVRGRANIAVSGGAGAGKTVLLNVLANMIPDDERVITLETVSELRLRPRRVVSLETRPPNLEGRGEISLTDLVVNALRMRPERLILGEMRGEEALHWMAGVNTGHDGSLFSLHAANPRDALARIETMMGMANPSIPLLALREQIATGLNFLVHLERLRDGERKLAVISEVAGLEGGIVVLNDLFAFEQTGLEQGRVLGRHQPTGRLPAFLKELRQAGLPVPMEMFVPKGI